MIKGVIFDMDGLMFDTENLSTYSWDKAGKEMGVDMPKEIVDRYRGKNLPVIYTIMREIYGEDFDCEACFKRKLQKDKEYMDVHGVPVKKGLRELLEYLKKSGLKAAVATSTNKVLAENILKMAEVYSYFDKVVCGDTVERSKPYPDIFQKAAEEIGLPMEECLVLEDSPAGLEAGKAAGGYVIHIPDVTFVPAEVKVGITAEMENLAEVIHWIEKENE